MQQWLVALAVVTVEMVGHFILQCDERALLYPTKELMTKCTVCMIRGDDFLYLPNITASNVVSDCDLAQNMTRKYWGHPIYALVQSPLECYMPIEIHGWNGEDLRYLDKSGWWGKLTKKDDWPEPRKLVSLRVIERSKVGREINRQIASWWAARSEEGKSTGKQMEVFVAEEVDEVERAKSVLAYVTDAVMQLGSEAWTLVSGDDNGVVGNVVLSGIRNVTKYAYEKLLDATEVVVHDIQEVVAG